jgi:hypothetical protein
MIITSKRSRASKLDILKKKNRQKNELFGTNFEKTDSPYTWIILLFNYVHGYK